MGSWSFVVAADIQVGSPRSFRFAPAWNENWQQARRQIAAMRPDLLLIAGDLTRDGSLHRFELEAVKADLDALPFPVHVVPGNMDTGNKRARVDARGHRPGQNSDLDLNVTSAQLRQFASVFGPLWWSFEHKGVRFSGFADVVVGSGLPEERAFWQWAGTQARAPRPRQHVWMMHYAPFMDRPDEPAFDPRADYLDWYFSIDPPGRGRLLDLFEATGATIVASGHIHCRLTQMVGSVRFDKAPATCFAQAPDRWPASDGTLGFLRYDVAGDDVRCAFVPLERVSNAKGYGPGGHPAAEARDYSAAWEK